MAVEKIQVPDIGDEEDVEIIEILVAPGDEVSENDSLIVLESDKAAMEIPSPKSGVIKDVLVKVGDKVSQGADIVSIEAESADSGDDSGDSESAEEGKAEAKKTKDEKSEDKEAEEKATEEKTSKSETKSDKPASASNKGGKTIDVNVPDLGDDGDVEVIEILVAEGDEISKEDGLVTLESDKAAMDVPSPAAGKVKTIKLKVGDKVNEGTLILELETAGEDESAEFEEKPAEEEKASASNSEQEEQAPAGNGKPELQAVNVPDLGEDSDVEIIEILVAEGDRIGKEDGLITLETDKAAMDVPSPAEGVVKSIKVKVGDKVSKGSHILDLETEGSAPAQKEQKSAQSAQESEEKSPDKPAADTRSQKAASMPEVASGGAGPEVYAGPAVRKLARELGVDLDKVTGTGSRGRIVKEDVDAYVKGILQGGGTAAAGAGLPGIEDIDFSQFGEIEEVEMSKLHRLTARNMSKNWLNVPHVTQFDEADVTELEEFRSEQKALAEKKGIKLTPLPFIVKACARALQDHPRFNVSLHSSGSKFIQKKYVHIGVAVATEAGLMVPVVKNVDRKTIWEIAGEIAELGEKAKSRKLSKDDMQGACFTVSSLGNLGGTGFTPIVNAPEVAILGVSKTTIKPVYMNNEFVPRKMLPFALSYDHRAVNGVDGGMFCNTLSTLLNDIRLLAL